MSLKENARFAFGLKYVRAFALNPDFTKATPARTIGGVGPFDFSGVDDNEKVGFTAKIDGTEYEMEIDLSGAGSASAVTVTEIVAALNIVFTDVTTPIALAASAEAKTNYLLIKTSESEGSEPVAIQLYGELAEITGIGQGFGTKILVSDTIRTMGETAVRKDSERITTTDGNGDDTDMITDGYYKGCTMSIVDTAEDWEMYALFEGLIIDADGGMDSPTFKTKRPYIGVEQYYEKYAQGQNHESDLLGYRKKEYFKCKGMGGDSSHEYGWSDGNYSVDAVTFRDSAGVLQPAWHRDELTIDDFNSLMIESL